MTFDSRRDRRRSIRLEGFDYSRPDAYFVTICAHRRMCRFGEIEECEMRLSEAGAIARESWENLPAHYPHVILDAFVVMPNHIHGIIVLTDDVAGAGLKPAPAATRHGLPEVVRAFKTFSARRINENRGVRAAPVWQRNYYEHIVRDEAALDRIRGYIAGNPANWAQDPDNPARIAGSVSSVPAVGGAGFNPAPTDGGKRR
jgi:putative transposase